MSEWERTVAAAAEHMRRSVEEWERVTAEARQALDAALGTREQQTLEKPDGMQRTD